MRPTALQVFTKTRRILSDDLDGDYAVGQWATNAYLTSHLQTAYSELFAAFDSFDGDRLVFTRYLILPPNQSHIPLGLLSGVSDFKTIDGIQARSLADGTTGTAASAAVVSGSNTRITSVGHGLTTGDLIAVTAVAAADNDLYLDVWPVTVVDADDFDILGAGPLTAPATVAEFLWVKLASGGWGRPYEYLETPKDQNPVGQTANWYSRVGDMLRVGGQSQTRLLQISFEVSGTLPETSEVIPDSTIIPIDDSLDFLAYATAVYGATPKVGAAMSTMLDRYRNMAYGPDYQEGDIGGFLEKVIAPVARAQQQRDFRFQKFGRHTRSRRISTYPFGL